MKPIFDRMIGAAALDAETYEQIESDSRSTAGALFVVFLASIAAAIGVGATDLAGMISITLVSFLSWLIWIGLRRQVFYELWRPFLCSDSRCSLA
jgi:hypothetical protein